PDGALREDTVLIECHECAERLRRQPLGENGARWPVAFESAVWHEPFRCAFGLDLFRRLAKGQGFSLGKDVRQQEVMVLAERIESLAEADEITGDELCPLVYQLVEGVLAVRPRLAPEDRPRLIVDRRAIHRHMLAVALHGQLL